jgi:hypothetical protein
MFKYRTLQKQILRKKRLITQELEKFKKDVYHLFDVSKGIRLRGMPRGFNFYNKPGERVEKRLSDLKGTYGLNYNNDDLWCDQALEDIKYKKHFYFKKKVLNSSDLYGIDIFCKLYFYDKNTKKLNKIKNVKFCIFDKNKNSRENFQVEFINFVSPFPVFSPILNKFNKLNENRKIHKGLDILIKHPVIRKMLFFIFVHINSYMKKYENENIYLKVFTINKNGISDFEITGNSELELVYINSGGIYTNLVNALFENKQFFNKVFDNKNGLIKFNYSETSPSSFNKITSMYSSELKQLYSSHSFNDFEVEKQNNFENIKKFLASRLEKYMKKINKRGNFKKIERKINSTAREFKQLLRKVEFIKNL